MTTLKLIEIYFISSNHIFRIKACFRIFNLCEMRVILHTYFEKMKQQFFKNDMVRVNVKIIDNKNNCGDLLKKNGFP